MRQGVSKLLYGGCRALAVVLGLNACAAVSPTGERSKESGGATTAEIVEATVQRTLEAELSGTTIAWVNPATGEHGKITPVRTYQTRDGTYCREFRAERSDDSASIPGYNSIACRLESGRWRIVDR